MSGSAPAIGSSLAAPPSINDVRTKAHLQLGARLGGIDLSSILLYTLNDNVPDSALPFLAWQFDILSPWWQLLTGPLSQRQLIQDAVPLHKFKGTPYAIQTSLTSLGFPLASIEEGQATWGGTSWPSDEGWAVFRVVIPLENVTITSYAADWDDVPDIDTLCIVDQMAEGGASTQITIAPDQITQAIAAIDFFKPERCWLDGIWFDAPPIAEPAIPIGDFLAFTIELSIVEPPLRVTDILTPPPAALADTKTTAPLYNTHFFHAGITYGASQPAVVDSGVTINGTPQE